MMSQYDHWKSTNPADEELGDVEFKEPCEFRGECACGKGVCIIERIESISTMYAAHEDKARRHAGFTIFVTALVVTALFVVGLKIADDRFHQQDITDQESNHG